MKHMVTGYFYVQDPVIKDAKLILDLMDAIRPKSINYENVRDGGTEEVKLCLTELK